ncbi:hypothetical protein [Clostridium sp. LCP25S3_F8]|uniref:hypothetical protein n=1 Tax=Clostridium sp. LCP25S3_F8 TaxID=3438751 RepID=UPI003F8F7EA3
MEDRKFERRSIDQISFKSGALYDGIGNFFIVFDFWDDPYTMVYLKFAQNLIEEHLMILKFIISKLDTKKLTIDLRADGIEEDINALMSIRIEVVSSIDYMNDMDFKKQVNYTFIEYIEKRGAFYRAKISKGFYKAITKYFKL